MKEKCSPLITLIGANKEYSSFFDLFSVHSRVWRATILVSLFFTLPALSKADGHSAFPSGSAYTIERQIRYSFTLSNTKNTPLEQGELWINIPIERTATQWCMNINASEAGEMTTNTCGNRVLHFKVELPPYGERIIKITADLKLASVPQAVSEKSETKSKIENRQSKISSPDPQAPNAERLVADLAAKLKGTNQIATAKNVYDWVAANLVYSGFHAANRGALWALRNRKGDCTEYAALFTALCRANGIPARMLSGFVCPKNMILKPYSLHDWAEFYDGSTWIMADPEQKNFNTRQADYIAFKILEQADPDRPEPLSIFKFEGPGLTVGMDK